MYEKVYTRDRLEEKWRKRLWTKNNLDLIYDSLYRDIVTRFCYVSSFQMKWDCTLELISN